MTYLPFWAVGLVLSGVVVTHVLLTRRLLAMSSRFTALVNRAREGPAPAEPEMSDAELVAALADATRSQFGDGAVAAASAESEPSPSPLPPDTAATHLVFLGSLALGGLLSFVLAGGGAPSAALRSASFTALFGSGPLAWAVLLGGGVLVGFGTRMAGGCTSGHGLCGVSRFQPGSLVATAAFFGMGIAVSFLMGAFL